MKPPLILAVLLLSPLASLPAADTPQFTGRPNV
jgi:hypothetical protein